MKDDTLRKVVLLIDQASEVELNSIFDAAVTRRAVLKRRLQQENLASISMGDRVRLRNVKPQYLNRTPGTVVGMKGSKFIVELDPGCDPRAVRRFGARPICPPQILEKI